MFFKIGTKQGISLAFLETKRAKRENGGDKEAAPGPKLFAPHYTYT